MSVELRGEGLALAYDGVAVLDGVDVVVAPGELLGLIGPNGAGKTSLVRLLAGLGAPDRGRVLLDGRALADWSRRERARTIALVPQDPRVEFPFTVLEIVLMGRAPYLTGLGFAGPDDVHRARTALARLGLEGLEARRLDALSGGERQRVFLARALAQDPAVLLLDEPTTHLDLRHQTEILDVVREGVRQRGLAALAVLHDLNLAAVSCDRLVLLAKGKVAAKGTPSEVLTQEAIERAFATRVHVRRHDLTEVPAILPLPRD
jgi:ABC-type cobalamin/Fe3+-siderophores transport system ATPase subunit